ncbi:MAG: Uma2 family endonuclease [Isosphaerales bacterium]
MSVSTTRGKPVTPTESIDRDGAIPPLENGDRLSRPEFERRYDATPNVKNAELIKGVVYLRLMVPQRGHGGQHADLMGWLGTYAAYTPGLDAGSSCHVRLDWDNEPQPDCVLFIAPESGGQVKIDAEGYLESAPDLVAEVGSSSVSYDLHDKLDAYRRNGVREYLVWRVLDRQTDWFVLRGERYELIAAAPDGTLRSTVFPGLWLDTAALLRGDLKAVLAVLQHGLNSPEQADFAAHLQRSSIEPLG